MPETRRYGPQDARRERAVKLLQDTVAAQLDDRGYDVDIEHFGDAVLAAMDEAREELAEALRKVLATEPLPEDEIGRDGPMDEAIDHMHNIARDALDAVDGRTGRTTAPVPREVLERAASFLGSRNPVARDLGVAFRAAARGERVEWPS